MLIKKIAIFLAGVITAIILLLLLLLLSFPLFKVFNSEKYDIVALLSVNVGILQTIIGFGAIFIALFAFINFKSTQDKLKEIDERLNKHDKEIEDYKINNLKNKRKKEKDN